MIDLTAQALWNIREIEAAAEKAGGYVADPQTVKVTDKDNQEFAKLRCYCKENGIPMSALTKVKTEEILRG